MWGGERHFYAGTVNALMVAYADQEAFKEYVPAYVLDTNGEVRNDSFRTWLAVSGLDCSKIDLFAIGLNTAFLMGSPIMRWMARVHGSCEVHGWIAKEHAPYFHKLIGDGIDANVLRWQMRGMEIYGDLLGILREPGEDIVMSYSVSDSFPNAGDWFRPEVKDVEERSELWEALPFEEQWDLAKAQLHPSLQMKPDEFEKGDFRFRCEGYDKPITVFDINRRFHDRLKLPADKRKR